MFLLNSACKNLASNLFLIKKILRIFLLTAADWKSQRPRWAGGRDPSGIQASDYCLCLFLSGESPVLSNVESGAEASSLPPQQRELILPICYILWQLETK